jgi:regulator of sigma E protease
MEFLSSLLGNVWSVFLIVLFFGGSIFVHELGHFLAARRRGAKVDRFSIGFGPAIWSWRGKDGVEYRVAWLPLGGYVLLPQLADLGALEGEPESDAARLPPVGYTTKMIVFVAGAFFNVLFAFALATILWVAGMPTSEDLATTRIGYISATMTLPDGKTVPSPAAEAGLKIGDTIRAIDGESVKDWQELLQTLVTSAGITADGRREAIFTIDRDGQRMDITVHPRLVTDEKVRKVGILAAYTPIVAQVPDKSYAAKLGLQVGDQLKALNGAPLLNLITLYDALQATPAAALQLTVLRGDRSIEVAIPADHPKETNGLLGAGFRTATGVTHTNPFTQLAGHAAMTFRTLWSLIHPHSDIGVSKLSGPVGIGRIFWDASEAGMRYVLWIAILVNVNLAIFNLLPLPILDGGQMVFATVAKIRGRPLSAQFIATAQSLFAVFLISMMLYVTVFGDFRRIWRDNRAEAQAKEAAAEEQKKAEQKKGEPAPAKP